MNPVRYLRPTDRRQLRLFGLAAAFLFVYALALTLAPAVRARSWQVTYEWGHWLGFLVWLLALSLAHIQTARWLPGRDPYLLAIAGLLCGWGMLTVWRLAPVFGLRQSLWLIVGILVLIVGLRLPPDLDFLKRYKYVWLTGSLLLTAMTLIFGANPLGYGPRMWLGCCGVYLQPSEPLKLMFIAYLAAFMADRIPVYVFSGTGAPSKVQLESRPLLPLLAPTLVMVGLALALLAVQRDLGTASIFFFLYAVIVYIATGDKRILAGAAVALIVAGILGYALFDVVRIRVDAWLNPWADPSGRSYQVVQSLISIAVGGFVGRGPGVGNPGLVPVSHSDLIYAAIVEEHGLLGAVGLLLLFALLAGRGLRLAIRARKTYHRYLAVGLVAYLVGQGLLIIGGSVRLLPLTGVTLPFVSYGGSSLLISFVALLILLHLSNQVQTDTIAAPRSQMVEQLAVFLLTGLALAALVTAWWGIVRAQELRARTDNPRRIISDRTVYRGAILARNDAKINANLVAAEAYSRYSFYPQLGNVVGYTNPQYGQSGLESNLDPYLRGWEGNPLALVWWSDLLYGQPPPGLDIRLSLDLSVQRTVDRIFGQQKGALVMLDAREGEILAISSHPTFDPNRLDDQWEELITDPDAPLLNRAAQELYPPGAIMGPLLLAQVSAQEELPRLPADLTYGEGENRQKCTALLQDPTWTEAIANGCPGAVAALGEAIGTDSLVEFYRSLGLFDAPRLRLPVAASNEPTDDSDPAAVALGQDFAVSPLQVALAAAALSAAGDIPAPWLATALENPENGWRSLPPLDNGRQVLPATVTEPLAADLAHDDPRIWQTLALISVTPEKSFTWCIAGTTSLWEGRQLVLALILEDANPSLAQDIGMQALQSALTP